MCFLAKLSISSPLTVPVYLEGPIIIKSCSALAVVTFPNNSRLLALYTIEANSSRHKTYTQHNRDGTNKMDLMSPGIFVLIVRYVYLNWVNILDFRY